MGKRRRDEATTSAAAAPSREGATPRKTRLVPFAPVPLHLGAGRGFASCPGDVLVGSGLKNLTSRHKVLAKQDDKARDDDRPCGGSTPARDGHNASETIESDTGGKEHGNDAKGGEVGSGEKAGLGHMEDHIVNGDEQADDGTGPKETQPKKKKKKKKKKKGCH